jgi:hypothetical protein
MATDDLISHAGPGSLASGEIGECPVVRWGRFSRKRVQIVGTAFVLSLTWAAIPRRDWFVSFVLASAFVFAERGIARWRMKKQKDGSTGWLRYGPSIVETGRVDEYAGAVRDLGRRVAPLRSECGVRESEPICFEPTPKHREPDPEVDGRPAPTKSGVGDFENQREVPTCPAAGSKRR